MYPRVALIIEIIHFFVVITWIGLFFVPIALWEDKVVFHFYFILTGILIKLFTGLLYLPYTNAVALICPLSIFTKRLYGHTWTSPITYEYVFIDKLLGKIGIKTKPMKYSKFKPGKINIVFSTTYITLIIVSIQYFFNWPIF